MRNSKGKIMACKKCNGPVGRRKDSPLGIMIKPQFKFSQTAKAIEKIKKGIKPPDFDAVCNKPALPNDTIGRFCKDNPELSFYTGFELAILQCGELLAKAQSDDK